MALDWDVLLDGVSIKEQIESFQITESKGAYARELTLSAADPSFYDQFDFLIFPQLRVEVKTKNGDVWVSQGMFYIEQPPVSATPDSTLSQGVWGRSETAKAGPPFAVKVSKEWGLDTTCHAIMTEMAGLCGLSINFEMDDYTVYAGSYAVESAYPIDVISELATFAGGYVGCNTDGELVIRNNVFHPAAADHTVTDIDIADISESIEYPEWGNRILISSAGSESSTSVELTVLDDSDCLPADGISTGTIFAFVSDQDGAIADNTMVHWTCEDGITLGSTDTPTGEYLMSGGIYNADNYHKVTVEFLIKSVVGIWAYTDAAHENNYWDESKTGCVFEGNEIAVHDPFTYCDQTLVISYITEGCAVNTVTAGNTAFDVSVTAECAGASATMDIKLGNICACGSSLNAKMSGNGVCFGNCAQVLAWATINNRPVISVIYNTRRTTIKIPEI
ncbi:hypothetical protein [Desulfobacula toluolica]|uniref:Uncharacterized protein n=1 Tax=Desulfobacula toluolica (strain DSM 7467 / Tol2) TaxID=651182 RepID=K0NK15_DESTT|nr:hypothetical protein [Desulfobacula toluolica]CCK81195.1 uncharacterized protein TOL2_C30360 [Desulfobacula toluolica Tol2]